MARYLGTLVRSFHPHIVAVQPFIGGEIVVQFDNEGRSRDGCLILVNVPEPKRSGEFWVNIYADGYSGISWRSRKEADNCLTPGRISCVAFPGPRARGWRGNEQ